MVVGIYLYLGEEKIKRARKFEGCNLEFETKTYSIVMHHT
jgi:hypothetical protein